MWGETWQLILPETHQGIAKIWKILKNWLGDAGIIGGILNCLKKPDIIGVSWTV